MADRSAQEVMQGYLAALVERGEFERFFAPDVRWTTMETGDEVTGREAVRDLIVGIHTIAFDAHPTLVGVLAEGSTALLEARFVGRHIGDFAGIAATGAEVDVPYCVGYSIADGLITELRAYMPVLAMRAQLSDAAAAGRATADVRG
jgi:predicted ester cyclase